MSKKHNLTKFLSVIALSSAFVVSSANALSIARPIIVRAAGPYKVRLVRNSFIYNKKDHRIGRRALRKGTLLKVNLTKSLKGLYYIGRGRYIKATNIRPVDQKHVRSRKSKRTKRGKLDKKKYSLILVKKPSINIDNGNIPSADSMVTNINSLPAGTRISWSKTPDINPRHDTAGEATIKVTYPDGSSTKRHLTFQLYGTDHIKLPAGYTRTELQASEDNPTSAIQTAAKKGNKINYFVSETKADDEEKIDILHLTVAQKAEISNFALRLINEGRSQIGSNPWHYDANVQSLADDVAAEYQTNHRGIQDADHYVPGLIRAAAKHGYDLDGINQLEDMSGDNDRKPKTMTDLKALTYEGILEFLFNGDEYHHACDILGAHQEQYWNQEIADAPFAISFSWVNGWNSVHFIRIPSNV